eukprot:g1150.t1
MPSISNYSGQSCEDVASIVWIVKGVLPNKFGADERFGFRGDPLGTAKQLMNCTTGYNKAHPYYTLGAYIAVYVALQAFAIPGPLILSIVAGALYPYWFGNLLIACCATTGASICYVLSWILGRGLARRAFPERLLWFQGKVKEKEKEGNLVWYMFFLRLTPLLPNWFVNIASPLAEVPYRYFFIATLLGQAPANLIHTSTGLTLSTLNSDLEKAANPKKLFAVLFVLQFVALIPTIFKKRLEKQL